MWIEFSWLHVKWLLLVLLWMFVCTESRLCNMQVHRLFVNNHVLFATTSNERIEINLTSAVIFSTAWRLSACTHCSWVPASPSASEPWGCHYHDNVAERDEICRILILLYTLICISRFKTTKNCVSLMSQVFMQGCKFWSGLGRLPDSAVNVSMKL